LFIFSRVQVHDCVYAAARYAAFAQNEPGSAFIDVDEFASTARG